MKERKRKPHARKRNWFLLILGLIIVAGVILAAVVFLPDDRSSAAEGDPSEIEAVSGTALTLLIDETDFITGSESKAAITVLYTDAVDAGILVVDETGRELGEIENDGSGRGEMVITVPTEQDGCVRYQAVSGDHASNQVTCYIHPEITAEMVRTLAEVSGDLGEFVTGQDFDDPLGPEALDKVREYLLSDSRVADAWEDDGAVLYATTDSLMGSYGLGASDEMSFGGSFSAAEETYRSYTAGKDVSGATLESSTVLTNTKLLYLSPLPEDRLVEFTKGSFVSKVLDLSDAIDGDFSYAERERVWELFETGEFTDAGFLMLVTHGKRLERRDGTYMFCFAMGKLGLEELEEVFGANRLNLGRLWGAYFMDEEAENEEEREYLYANDSYRLLYDYTPNESESSQYLFATTNYLESVLKDRVFDNTIIYFSVCHSAVDEELAALFLTHGAGAFIGSVPELDSTVSYATLSALAEVLGSGGTIGDVQAKALSGAYDAEVLEWYNSTITEGYRRYREDLIRAGAENIPDEIEDLTLDDVRESRETSEMVYWKRTSPDRTVLGMGTLSGTVIDSDGEPIADAEVTIHRWLDHGYEEAAVTKTDKNGHFELPEADWGLYGITAKKSDETPRIFGVGYGVLEFSPEHDTAEPIVLHDLQGGFGYAVEYDGDVYYWKYNKLSFSDTCTLGSIGFSEQCVNQMIRRGPNGEDTVVFEATGRGKFALVNDRIYYQDSNGIVTCTLDGEDTTELGPGTLEGITNDGSYLICSKYTWLENNIGRKDLYVINVAAGRQTLYVKGADFIACWDGVIYYQPDEADTNAAERGQMTVSRILPDGTGQADLHTTAPDLYGGDQFYTEAIVGQMYFGEKYIYYSYGSLAGSGIFFQGGKIIRMGYDGSGATVVAGEPDHVAADFTINGDGSLTTHPASESRMLFSSMEDFYVSGGSVYQYDRSSGASEALIDPEDYSMVGTDLAGRDGETAIYISQIQHVGGKVYFLAHNLANQNTPWWVGYVRQNSAFLEKDLETGSVKILYTF